MPPVSPSSFKASASTAVLAVGLLIRVSALTAAPAAETVGAVVRGRMTAEILNPDQGSRPDEEPAAETPAKKTLASQLPDGSWPDIPYDNRDRSLWKAIKHVDRVLALAKASRKNPADTVYLPAAVRGLEFWLKKDPQSDNWWWNTIGLQQHLGPVMILLRDNLSKADFKAGCAQMGRSHVDKMTGTNLAWEAANLFVLGALTDDSKTMKTMLELITHDISVGTKEGIQPDWSFHQHGAQLNAGNYGLGFLETCGRYAGFVQGTDLQLSAEKIGILSRFALRFQDWVVWGKYMDLSSCGRQLDLPNAQTRKASALASECLRLENLDPAIRAPVDALEERISGKLPPGASAPVGNRYYWRSDFLIHRPGTWYASVKMYSPRVLRTETAVNSENYKGYHLSDGVTFVLVRGDEYADIQPVWDWRKLPGITFRATKAPFPYGGKAPALNNPEPFVGGVSDGVAGAAAMDIHKEDVFARKAWFCFPGAIVCLGAGLHSEGPDTLTTSINQCLLRGPVSVLSDEGWKEVRPDSAGALGAGTRAVYHDNVGYLLIEPSTYTLTAGPQKGSWAELRKEGVSRAVITKNVFSLWIDHGPHPNSGSYAYALVPGVSLSAVAEVAKTARYAVVSNTSKVQAVYSKDDGLFEIAFHGADSVSLPDGPAVAVDAPCLVMVDLRPGNRKVWVSDPTQTRQSIHIKIGEAALPFSLPTGAFAGSSVGKQF